MSYVTGISGNVISAASAGYAPTNSADVSAIASAYSESAASGKLDESASSSFYTTANESGFLTGLPVDISVRDLSASRHVRATATGEDLYGNFDYAGMYFRSGSQRPYNIGIDNTGTNFYIATAKNGFERIYASSIQSWNGKLDSSASSSFYTTANESGFVDSAYVDSAVSGKADSSALSSYALSSDVSGVIDTVSSNSASWGGGATGDYVEKSSTEVAIGSANSADSSSFAQGIGNTASYRSFAQGTENSATFDSFAQGNGNRASDTSFAQGHQNFASARSFAHGYSNSASSYSFAQGIGNSATSYSFAQGSGNSAALESFVHGEGNIASSNSFAQGYINSASSFSFAQGWGNSAKNTAAVFGKYNLHGDGNTSTGNSAAFAIGDGTAYNARHDLMLVTKDGEITMYSSTADTVGTGIMSSIRAISAAATGGGGVDSATVSSIASSYAQDVSAAASGTVDLVSTQSANWGGSALGLSAGPGVKLEKVGDTLVASVDGPLYLQETLAGYWNGSAVYQQFISGTATTNGNTNFTIPDEITGTNIVNKWIDPSNSFMYYNTTSNAAPISWCMGSGRYGSVAFVGSVIQYRCVDTSPTTLTAYIAIKYMKA